MVANSAITTHNGHPPPATLQRGIITEIDNVKKFLSETFPKHATPSDVKGQTQDCVRQNLETPSCFQFWNFCLFEETDIDEAGEWRFVRSKDFMNLNWVIYFSHSLRLDLVRREQITWSGKQTRYWSTNNWAFALLATVKKFLPETLKSEVKGAKIGAPRLKISQHYDTHGLSRLYSGINLQLFVYKFVFQETVWILW